MSPICQMHEGVLCGWYIVARPDYGDGDTRVSFDEATSVFFDVFSVTIPDPDHSVTERRFLTMGSTAGGRILVIAHTERGRTIRIITARPASASERKRHET